MIIKLKNGLGACIALVGLGLCAVAMAGVGEVVFAVGDAKVAGASASLKPGDTLEVGQTLVTGLSGHIHIRFADQAFVSVRPNSELKIEQYVYDQAAPENSQVKFNLVKGTSRLITGKAGQANKQGFRLNTPVAAIGIRGTDFIVQTVSDVTRVMVQQGGVRVSPFNQDCNAQALGACGGSQARDLAGNLTDAFLEVRDQGATQLVQGQGRKLFALPHPEEPRVKRSGDDKPTAALPADMNGTLMWGRWSGASATPAGLELLGQNEAFVLYRLQDNINLPQSGFVNFNVVEAQGYARSSTGALTSATISSPSLTVNFATMQYTTKFNWESAGRKLQLSNKGVISDTAHFSANRDQSNFVISGGLNSVGDEAAYLFIKRLPGDDAYGVMRWVK